MSGSRSESATTNHTMAALPASPRNLGLALAWLLVGVMLMSGTAFAGRPCEQRRLSIEEMSNGINLAAQTAAALKDHNVQVGVIARAGQDLSKWGQRYSHLGIVYLEDLSGGEPVWRVVHKLNECGSDGADVYRQGLAEFFMEAPHEWKAAVVPLAPAVAEEVLPSLSSRQRLTRLHEPRYSMVAYAWGTRYQQSNQWAIETLAMLLEPRVQTRGQAQRWLREMAYQPDRLRLGTFTRLGARMTKANVAFDDHPAGLRFSGRIDTTTADSVLRWLERSSLGEARFVVRLDLQRAYGGGVTAPTRDHRPVGSSADRNAEMEL
ncbi:MAG: DUF2145 domain-containing protein [Pseudomonadota bacterium]